MLNYNVSSNIDPWRDKCHNIMVLLFKCFGFVHLCIHAGSLCSLLYLCTVLMYMYLYLMKYGGSFFCMWKALTNNLRTF